MSRIVWAHHSDEEKLDILRVLYRDIKNGPQTERSAKNRELVIAETQIVYNRLKQRSH